MYAMDALKQAAKNSGMPLTQIGVALGKTPQYVNATITRRSTPQADKLALMLEVCGYGLYAMPIEQAPKDAMRITATDADTQ